MYQAPLANKPQRAHLPGAIEHYENFPVASWMCPAHLRGAIASVYHFARTADDLADEGDYSAVKRLEDLSEYREDLTRCVALVGSARENYPEPSELSRRWPHVFAPLLQTLAQFSLPPELLHVLLNAFEQDVVYTEAQRGYRSKAELLEYCQKSAAPIGRILLHLYKQNAPEQLRQSDDICTALQLINFWQDLSIDVPRGRHYLVQGSTVQEEIAFAKSLMRLAAPLCLSVPGRAGWELRAVVAGGLRVIEKLERCNPLVTRPKLTRLDYVTILWRCCFRSNFAAPN